MSETALTVRDAPLSIYDRMPDPLSAVEKMGAWLAKSGMLGIKTPEQGVVVAMTCMQERITPLEFRRRYHIIQGAPSMRADYMQSEFQRAGGRLTWDRTDDEVCELTLTHPEHAPQGFRVRVELATLQKRGVCTNREQYAKYPRQMLRARAVSEGIRAIMPSINAGEYTPEEMEFVHAAQATTARVIEAEPVSELADSVKTIREAINTPSVAALRAYSTDERLPEATRAFLAKKLAAGLSEAGAAKYLADIEAKLAAPPADEPPQGAECGGAE